MYQFKIYFNQVQKLTQIHEVIGNFLIIHLSLVIINCIVLNPKYVSLKISLHYYNNAKSSTCQWT